MKRTIKKWTKRLMAIGVLIVGLLIGIVLNPSFLYADHTEVGNYTIYHNAEIDNDLPDQLECVTLVLAKSELFDSSYGLNIYLNDGSYYQTLLEKIRGKAFAWGFYNRIVIQGKANYKDNYVELNGYHWNFKQLIAHEAIHCYQFNKFGFWKSNPIAKYPNWKWEGYPEYVSRQGQGQQDLIQTIDHFFKYTEKNKNSWAIKFSDGTIAPIDYYKDWLLVKYSLDIKQLSYESLLKDSTTKEMVEKEMMNWYNKMKKLNQ